MGLFCSSSITWPKPNWYRNNFKYFSTYRPSSLSATPVILWYFRNQKMYVYYLESRTRKALTQFSLSQLDKERSWPALWIIKEYHSYASQPHQKRRQLYDTVLCRSLWCIGGPFMSEMNMHGNNGGCFFSPQITIYN